MKTAAVVGCLHVETKKLRSFLSKIPATILQQVLRACSSAQDMLPVPARLCLAASVAQGHGERPGNHGCAYEHASSAPR